MVGTFCGRCNYFFLSHILNFQTWEIQLSLAPICLFSLNFHYLSILKEINPEYSVEGLMMRLKPPDAKSWLNEKDADAGKDWGHYEKRWDGWMASPIQWTWVWASSGRWWRTGKPGVLQSMGSQRVGHDWATEQQQRDGLKKILLQFMSACFSCVFV